MATGFLQMDRGSRSPETGPFLLRTRSDLGSAGLAVAPTEQPRMLPQRAKPHQEIARLLCELARQERLADSTSLVARQEIAQGLGFTLVRVKRSLALLALSGVVECVAEKVRVLDWLRLCDVARIEPILVGLRPEEQAEPLLPSGADVGKLAEAKTTAGGEPACFV